MGLGATTGLIAVLALALLPSGPRPAEDDGAAAGPFFDAPLPAPGLDLTTHAGEPWSLAAGRGTPAAVFFGYTHCPDVCPLTLARLSRVLDEMEPGAAAGLRTVFVTVDPARDDGPRLAAYLAPFHPSIVGLTGEREAVARAARAFGVGIFVPPHEEGAPYLVDHTARTFLLDAEGRVVGSLPATASTDDLRDAIRTLLAEHAGR